MTILVKIIETAGRSHIITTSDGSSFRINSRQVKTIDEKKLSQDFYIAEERGMIRIYDMPQPASKKKEE